MLDAVPARALGELGGDELALAQRPSPAPPGGGREQHASSKAPSALARRRSLLVSVQVCAGSFRCVDREACAT
jgi:hypothetical protein